MTIFATYCSSKKDSTPSPLSAISRYQSDRINRIYQASILIDVPCYILSGKYGLIYADKPIEYYDHLLRAEEVSSHAVLISTQLKENGIKEIVFYSNTLERDSNLKPYLDCIKEGCHLAKAKLNIVFIALDE